MGATMRRFFLASGKGQAAPGQNFSLQDVRTTRVVVALRRSPRTLRANAGRSMPKQAYLAVVKASIPPIRMTPLAWVGRAKEELKEFPEAVMRLMGHALLEAQAGDKSVSAKPLQGFGGAGILEIVEDHDGNTYRAVYTVKFAGVVYVLHCF